MLGQCSTRHRAEVAAAVKPESCRRPIRRAKRRLAECVERFAKSAPKAVVSLETGFEDAMAVMALLEKYRKRLRTTNMQERLNEETVGGTSDSYLPNDELLHCVRSALCWSSRMRYCRNGSVPLIWMNCRVGGHPSRW
ncbi:MAG: transposase [Propionivibrio sp.]|nr:transposase [Propionivibrio sp.]